MGPLEVEAWVENKDIGFVHVGQQAEIKVAAFPFTRYGTIPAQVRTLSHDAVSPEKDGTVPAQVRTLLLTWYSPRTVVWCMPPA